MCNLYFRLPERQWISRECNKMLHEKSRAADYISKIRSLLGWAHGEIHGSWVQENRRHFSILSGWRGRESRCNLAQNRCECFPLSCSCRIYFLEMVHKSLSKNRYAWRFPLASNKPAGFAEGWSSVRLGNWEPFPICAQIKLSGSHCVKYMLTSFPSMSLKSSDCNRPFKAQRGARESSSSPGLFDSPLL